MKDRKEEWGKNGEKIEINGQKKKASYIGTRNIYIKKINVE